MTDVQLRPIGFFWGSLAVLSTAIFQIWQGTKQKEFGINAMQLQSGIATWQSAQVCLASLLPSVVTHCRCPTAVRCSPLSHVPQARNQRVTGRSVCICLNLLSALVQALAVAACTEFFCSSSNPTCPTVSAWLPADTLPGP